MILCNRCKSVKCRFSGWLNRTRLLPLNSLICHFRLIQAICVKDISPNLKSCELMRDGTGTFQCKADVFLTLDSLDCLSAWVPTGLVLRRIPGALLWKPEKRKEVTRMHECEGLVATPGKDPQIVKDGPLQTLNVLLFKPLSIVQFCFCCVDMSVKEKTRKTSVWEMFAQAVFFPNYFSSLVFEPWHLPVLPNCIKYTRSRLQSRFTVKYFYLFYLLKWTNTGNLLCGLTVSLNLQLHRGHISDPARDYLNLIHLHDFHWVGSITFILYSRFSTNHKVSLRT